MKKLLFLFLLIKVNVYSQAPTWAWVKSGDNATSGVNLAKAIANDPQGNSYVTGKYNSKIFVQKFDQMGNVQWNFVSNSKILDNVSDIAVDQDGNVFIIGTFWDTLRLDNNYLYYNSPASEYGTFVAKFDTDGNLQWAKISSPGSEGHSITITVNNHILIGGSTIYSTVVNAFEIGGISENMDEQDRKYIFLAKLDTDGNGEWIQLYEGAIATNYAKIHDIKVDFSTKNIYCTGQIEGSNLDFGGINLNTIHGNNIYTAKLDSAGNVLWVKLGRPTNYLDNEYMSGQGIGFDANGNVYMAGWFKETVTFGSLNASAGTMPLGNVPLVLVKYDADGNEQFIKTFAYSDEPDYFHYKAFGMEVNSNGDVYIQSRVNPFITATTVDFGDGVTYNASLMKNVNYVVKLNANGTTQWVKVVENSNDIFYDFSSDINENIYVCGYWINGTGFDNLPAPTGNPGIFVAKMGDNSSSVINISNYSNKVNIYPNPNDGNFTIQTMQPSNFQLTDMAGRLIKTYTSSNHQLEIHEHLPAGMYFLVDKVNNLSIKLIVK